MDWKEHKNQLASVWWYLFIFFFYFIFLVCVSIKLLWMEKSLYYLSMCSIHQKGKISRLSNCGIQGMSEEHAGRYSVMTVMVFETCSQVPVQNFQAVPSSGYRSAETPLTSLFSCFSLSTLLIPHKRCCHTDGWSNGWPRRLFSLTK